MTVREWGDSETLVTKALEPFNKDLVEGWM